MQSDFSASLPADETRLFLAAIVDSLEDAVVSINLEGIITSWNRAAESLYGYPAEEVIGQQLSMVTPPAEVAGMMSSFERIRQGGELPRYDTVRIHKLGHEMNIEVQLSPVKNPAGDLIGLSTMARDVTELRRSQEALGAAEKRLRLVSDLVPQLIWENEPAGEAIYFNRRWYEYSGISPEALRGAGWQAIAHPDDVLARDAWRATLLRQEPFEGEVRLQRADGSYRWHLLRNVPLKDGDGRVLGWYGSATDIDKLRTTEISLLKTSERLRAVLESAIDFAILTLDVDGYVTDWNRGAEKIFNFTKEEAIGQYTDIIFTPEDLHGNIPEIEIQRAIETGQSIDERWHLRKDGTRFFMSGVMTPIYQDGITGFVKVARDITERKITEEALLLSEQRKQLALQSAQLGEWDWDIASGRIRISDNAAFLLGMQGSDADCSGKEFLRLVQPEDAQPLLRQLRTALAGLNIFQAEFRIQRADDGQLAWLNAYGRVIGHQEGKAVRMIGVIFDISDRKLQEKQKDDFISIASHELKTPVAAIQAYCDVLEDMLQKNGQPEYASLVTKLNGQVERLTRLMYRLLDTTNLSEGNMQLSPRRFDLNLLVAAQVKEHQLLAPGHRLRWQPAALPLVQADYDRIRQVVDNLISNAVKYSPAGSEVIISTRDDQDGALVRVQDFGIGIHAAEKERIFQRYYRAQMLSNESYPGFGLGLFISAEIIRQHFGIMAVDSVAGQGSTFYFKLPYS